MKSEFKNWSVRYSTEEGGYDYVSAVAKDVRKVLDWVIDELGISPDRIDYLSASEANVLE